MLGYLSKSNRFRRFPEVKKPPCLRYVHHNHELSIMSNRVFLGTRKSDGSKIYLYDPEWSCGWYWSFGHLGNTNEHYHLSSHMPEGYLLPEYLTSEYELNPILDEKRLWALCELVTTAYALNRAAEVFTRGGSNISLTLLRDKIQNPVAASYINEDALPKVFRGIESLFQE